MNDGESLEFDEIRGDPVILRRLRLDNCERQAAFVVLGLWPFLWVWINPHGTRVVPCREEELGEEEPR